jgi:hypothetical protein
MGVTQDVAQKPHSFKIKITQTKITVFPYDFFKSGVCYKGSYTWFTFKKLHH